MTFEQHLEHFAAAFGRPGAKTDAGATKSFASFSEAVKTQVGIKRDEIAAAMVAVRRPGADKQVVGQAEAACAAAEALFSELIAKTANPKTVPRPFVSRVGPDVWYLTDAAKAFLRLECKPFLEAAAAASRLIAAQPQAATVPIPDQRPPESEAEALAFLDGQIESVNAHFAELVSASIWKNVDGIDPKIQARFQRAEAHRAKDTDKLRAAYATEKIGELFGPNANLARFAKRVKDLRNRHESALRRLDVKAVEALNRPKAKVKKDPKTKTFPFVETEYVIDLRGVCKYYSNGVMTSKVLNGIDLRLRPGELTVILGPSGSGKTTLLNIISGMDRATSGRTIVANTDLINLNNTQLTEFRRANVGYIFQQYGLLPNLTVRENIEIGAFLQPDPAKRLDIDELLRSTGMHRFRDRLPSELSGGQQQRVSILRAIAKNPKIIFGDEPTGALDETMTQVVLDQFVKVNKEYGTTIILVTHNPLIAELATCVIRVHDGKIKSVERNPSPKKVSEIDWGGN